MEHDKNYTKDSKGMFRVQNQDIMTWFSNFSALVVFVLGTVMKF